MRQLVDLDSPTETAATTGIDAALAAYAWAH